MEHYICRNTTELPAYMFVDFRVPANQTMYTGEIYMANKLDTKLGENNFRVFIPEEVKDIKKDVPAIILSNDFESMIDGRRPDGNPDYTTYTYNSDSVITGVYLLPEVKFELSLARLDNAEEVIAAIEGNSINDTYIGINNDGKLFWTDDFNDIESLVYMKVEINKNFRIGGNFGIQFADSLVVRVKHKNPIDSNPDITAITDNLTPDLKVGEDNVAVGATVMTLTAVGGTAPITFALKENETAGVDNDKFVIEQNRVNVGDEALTEGKHYKIYVEASDSKGKTFNEGFDIPVEA